MLCLLLQRAQHCTWAILQVCQIAVTTAVLVAASAAARDLLQLLLQERVQLCSSVTPWQTLDIIEMTAAVVAAAAAARAGPALQLCKTPANIGCLIMYE
jgi:hypothetical protein